MEYNVLLILTPHPLTHPEGVPLEGVPKGIVEGVLEGVLENSPSGIVEVTGEDDVGVI